MLKFQILTIVTIGAMSLSSCSSHDNLTVREFTDGDELVQMQYNGDEVPSDLVKEVRFYLNGPKKTVTPMKNGKVEGVVEHFYPSGHLRSSVSFSNGVQNGPFKHYDDQGVLVFEGNMANGMKQGVWTTWYDETQKEEEKTYVNDTLDGTWTYWYIDGSVKRTEVYAQGEMIERTEIKE